MCCVECVCVKCGMCCVDCVCGVCGYVTCEVCACVFTYVHAQTFDGIMPSEADCQLLAGTQVRYSCLRTYRKLEGRGTQCWFERFAAGMCLAPDSILAWMGLTLIQGPP